MSWGDWLLLALIGIGVFLAIRSIRKGAGCCGNCASCHGCKRK